MPYSPAMNGIAERANRTITETTRGLLIEARLPEYFWPDAVRSACVAKNRALTHVGADKWVPYVEWIGRKPKVDMLRVNRCMCMALVPKHLRHNKLGAKAIWAVHLGMAQNSKGWLLWDPFTKKFLVSRDCKFMENLMYKDWKAENEAKIGMRLGDVKSSGLEHVELPLGLSSGSTTTRQSSLVNRGEEAKDAEEEEDTSFSHYECSTDPSHLAATPRPSCPSLAGAALMVGEDEESAYEECAFAFFSPVEMPGEPATLKEALESSDAEEWKKAMESELKSIEENGTWELVELPEGRKAITSKWLFKIKSDADGKIERYKSRLVVEGYQQKEKVDYKELFAPVVKPTTLRTLLAGAAIKGWVVKQMDVTTAFLNGVLEEEIFMAQLEGFDDGRGRVLRLKKALYGLKQAPRQWYLKLRGLLEEIGFTPSTADHSLFMLGEGEQRSFMVVYVDDILIFSPSSDLVKEVMLKLQDKFKCKALGDLSFYLGLHIERDVEKRCMRVHQRKYLEALAATFGQSEGHVATPFPSGFKCVKGPEEESVGEEERRRFHSLVGSLMYAAVYTRPDVAFATGHVARYCAAVPAEFLDRNPPPMYITLYFIVTGLPDSLCSARDHFLSLDTTSPTVNLLEQNLLAAETSAVAVGAARGTPRPPFFEGCSPSPLAPSYASAAAADLSFTRDLPSPAPGPVPSLVSHLCTSVARYCAAVPAEFLDRNPPPMDHFLSLDTTSPTVDLLEQHLLAAETSAVAVGAARGTPRPPFFEGCSPSPLAPSYASAAAADVSVPADVGVASASAKRRSSKGKGGRGGGGGSGGGGGGSGSVGGGSSGGGGGGGTGGGSGGSGGVGGGSGGSGGSGGGGTGSGGTGARRVGSGGGQRQQQQHRSETPSPQQLREWFLHGASGGSCPYAIRTGDRAGQTCGRLHSQHRCFSRLDDAWSAEFGDDVHLPRWADLLKSRIAIFDLDIDAILFAMNAWSVSAEGDCFQCVPPDPGLAAAALGASESGTLPGTAPAEALHSFTLDSGASRCFFRDSTTLTPLPAPVPVRLADPFGGPVVARSSTFLPCPVVPSVSLSGLHLPLV
ncbi:unnamed protein product [Closterium sp. NIES-53]